MAFENIYSNPLIWGPPTWYIIHILAYTYNEENREQYKRFFDVFKEVIPCPHCKKDYNEYINLKPPDFTTRRNFIKWTSDLHNYVNMKTKKQQYNQDYINHLYLNPDGSLKPIRNNDISHFITLFSKSCQGEKCQNLIMSLVRIYPDKSKDLKGIFKMDNNLVWNNPLYVKLIVRSISLKIL
tara:strand:- start:659 stop:1204 length:546 start_codon:yes stop_codon:yes gene_type:complete